MKKQVEHTLNKAVLCVAMSLGTPTKSIAQICIREKEISLEHGLSIVRSNISG